MATDEARTDPPEAEMLPDERAMVIERLDELDEDEYLTTEEVADDLGIELDRD